LHEQVPEEVEKEIPALLQILLYFPLRVVIFFYEQIYFYFLPLILFGAMTFDDSVMNLSKEKQDGDGLGIFYT
jgi:hypothetical protein